MPLLHARKEVDSQKDGNADANASSEAHAGGDHYGDKQPDACVDIAAAAAAPPTPTIAPTPTSMSIELTARYGGPALSVGPAVAMSQTVFCIRYPAPSQSEQIYK